MKRIQLFVVGLIVSTGILAQNTLPANGNVGIGTTTPSTNLEVVGNTKLTSVQIMDSVTMEKPVKIKDSVKIESKLTVDQDVKIKGKTVFVEAAKAKSDLKILGTTKMKGNAFVEGNFKLKGLADSTTTDNRFLMIKPNGKAVSMNKSTLTELVYQDKGCNPLSDGTFPAPVWSNIAGTQNTYGILYTGANCDVKVGINTNNPIAELDVRGWIFSGNIGVGLPPVGSSLISLRQVNPNNDGLNISFTTASANTTGVGVRVTVLNEQRKAFVVRKDDPNGGHDVFYVFGDGTIRGRALRLTLTGWADYVFEESYPLMSLNQLEDYIKINKHLPEIPTEQEVKKEGVDVGDTEVLLLQKIEELTLYIINLNKKIVSLEKEISTLK